ncbi:hypothetical protein LTS15_010575 [Exophiala xenobiotica]|nr:hypothetical protein LTS15_010575 [Exophiala xenobiotica]
METPPNGSDWPLASSLEDCAFAQERDDTPWHEEGDVSQLWEAPTPVLYMNSQGQPRWSRSVSSSVIEPPPQSLGFVQMKDWNRDAAYDGIPPAYIHYRIDWRLMIKKTVVSRNTIEDIVLEPTSFGPRILLPQVEELLKRKTSRSQPVRPDDTDVVAKVIGRPGDDFVAQYEAINIDWAQIERRLLKWSDLFRKGKKLTVNIIFHYLEVSPVAAINTSRTRGKQVRGTATQQMQTELTAEANAEQATTGRPAAWQHVYALFRCPGPPCDLKPWCWFDSQKNKRFGLKSHHLRTLIRHKESNKPLETHDQMPEDLREQIYKEEEQNERRKQTQNASSSSGMLPIQITNVLPSPASIQAETAPKTKMNPIEISGLRDESVQDYCDWQQTQVRKPSLKGLFKRLPTLSLTEALT